MRLPLEPSLDDRRHVERVFRDLAGIASAVDVTVANGRNARQLLTMWLSDLWLIHRALDYSPYELLEILGELPLPEREMAGLDEGGGGERGEREAGWSEDDSSQLEPRRAGCS